jgi:heptosyltransferase-1
MYTLPKNPTILIVKTSSLGDIIQAMSVLDDLCRRFPTAQIDWVVEEKLKSIVEAHPLVSRAIGFSFKPFRWKYLKFLRQTHYDLVFDLQSNTKSGLITLLARGKTKIGFGLHSVREWPNVLATNVRFEVPLTLNIRHQHLQLLSHFFQDAPAKKIQGVRFNLAEENTLGKYLVDAPSPRIMVCPGSRWVNKQLPLASWTLLLKNIEQELKPSFFLVWGSASEKAFCEEIQRHLSAALVVDRLSFPLWQNLMNEMDLVIAVDSAALHLAGTTKTPTFSLFGPTSSSVFKPMGEEHGSFQGSCPYKINFTKTCPKLRTCPTGACIRELEPSLIFRDFLRWWKSLNQVP